METISRAYIVTFEDVNIIGGLKEYRLKEKGYPIIGIPFQDSIIDIKSKEIYPILKLDEMDHISLENGTMYACLDEMLLRKIGVFHQIKMEEEDEVILEDKIKETLSYIETLNNKESNIISYQKFKKKREQYLGRK